MEIEQGMFIVKLELVAILRKTLSENHIMDDNSQALTQPSNPQPTLGLPTTWPGGWGAYKYSKQAVMLNIGTLILLFLINIASSFLGVIPVLGLIATYVLGVVVSVASAQVMLAGVEGTKMSVGQSLSVGFSKRGFKYFLNILLVGLILIGSVILLIIPFFFIFPRVVLAPYFVALDNMGPVEAIEASWAATKGHVGKIYGMIGVGLVFALLCLVLVGIYFSIMYAAVFVVFYAWLKKQSGVADAVPAVSPVEATVPTAEEVSPAATVVDNAPQVDSPEQTPPSTPAS